MRISGSLERRVLVAILAVATMALVGCLGPLGPEGDADGDTEYSAELSGDVTGSLAGSARVEELNTIEGVYRFAFGIDDLVSEPPTSLAWVFSIDTYSSTNGLAVGEYEISGEIGTTLDETDVAYMNESGNRYLYTAEGRYRFAGTDDSPGSLTLTSVTDTFVVGSFTIAGPFEFYNGDNWEAAGEATLTTDFNIGRPQ